MKRKLLLAALCVVGALGFQVNAQIVSGTTYYLQNKASGRYISSGHAWFTRSTLSLVADYPITLNASGDGYILKVVGSNQLGHNLFVDNGSSNVWTVTAVSGEDNVYTISNGTNYLGYDGTWVLSSSLTDPDADAAKWYIRSKDDYLAMFANASAENPVDASFYITGPSYDYTDPNRNNAWTMSGFGAGTELSRGSGTTAINPYVVERYNGTGSIKQTLTGLKKGMYGVSVYGFYRAGNNTTAPAARDAGTEAQNAIFYVGTTEKALKSVYDEAQTSAVSSSFTTSTSYGYVPNARSTAGQAFANGYYKNTIYVYVGSDDTSLEIGVKKEATVEQDWAIIDNWCMTYYGSEELTATEIELAASVKAYKEALAAAQAYQDVDMFNADKTTLNTAITDNTIDLSGSVTEEQLTTATTNLNAAAAVAAKAQVRYTTYTNIVTAIDGKTDVDVTSYIANLSFEEGNLTSWNSVDGGDIANNGNWNSGKVGTYFIERWKNGVALGNGSLTHDVITLPAGVYTITTNAQNIEQYNSGAAGTGYFFCVNNEQTEIGASGNYSVTVKYTADTDVTLKFLLDNCTGNWISCDDIKVIYNGTDFPAVTLVEGKMNAAVSAAQTAAKEAYDAEGSLANYNALTAAIAAAQASKEAYAYLTAAVTKIQAAAASAKTNGATVSTEAQTALTTLFAAYTVGTIADADVMTKVAEGYDLVAPIIKTQTAATGDFTLAIRNQSFEYGDMTAWTATESSDTGVRETANSTYAATGTDGFYLFNTWWQGVPVTQTVTGLPNGQYTLTASVSSDGATIYLIANGEHNDGIETGDTYPGKDVMQETSITFLVKDGTATIGAVGGADGTAGVHKEYVETGYWWYKADNFRLVKNRDLTPEEMAVIPTAIALYNGEEEVTAPIALDATTQTVTLTPHYTPTDATAGYITWETSDATVATVADGVVTALSSGTATITVTSTLDATVTATATINVNFPETEVAAYSNDGATRYVHHYGGNLIKNGTFEYPNSFQGWKSGANGNCDANNFSIVTDGSNKYIQAKESKGAGDSHSISTAWPIEAGKTYVFGYKVKATTAGNSGYHVVSMTNTIGTETAKVSIDATPVTTSWTDVAYEFTNSDNYAYVQFRARWLANSTSFDDFYLVEKTADDDVVGNVEYALAAIPTANIGTNAFQYSQTAIDAANALVQGTATVAEVEASYEAVQTINAPADGDVFNVMITTSDNYGFKNNPLTFNADNASGAYFPKNTGIKAHFAQQIAFTKVEGNKYTLSMVNADGSNVYLGTNKTINNSGTTSQMRLTTNASKALAIEIAPTSTEGVYNLRNTEANALLGCQDADNNERGGIYTTNAHSEFTITTATKPSLDLAIGTDIKYGTRIFPFAPARVTGVKYYTCATVDDISLTLTEVEGDLAANTPYIVENTTAADIDETLSGFGTATADTYTQGLLTGVYAPTEVSSANNYVLQNLNDKVAFYQVDPNTPITVPANRAYLTYVPTLSVGAQVRGLFFPENDDATGITGVDALTSGQYDAIYTADGVKVQTLQKGLNIVKKGNKSYKIFVK